MLNNPNMQMMNADGDIPQTEKQFEKTRSYWVKKIKDLDHNIGIFRKKIVEQKRSLGGVNAGQESQHALNK